ncbi:DUF11 domain-containing protein [Diaphorobacter sp. HDW4A]|uniref:DUF11 domain-containing protein n=1 Tax=Diaphorobacter sp. HDW4A TaxID=2714924 RepID=UPI001409E791|nr:DUF11 domain-containing protein [Diaphorobacter sp. HDW4A]QIL78792.1 DUF11 domain-containing protein [Diaphorobacter sp. HDW4A]
MRFTPAPEGLGRQYGGWFDQVNQLISPRMLRVTFASMLCLAVWGQAEAQTKTPCNGTLYVSNAAGNDTKTFFNSIDVSTNPPTLSNLGATGGANYNALGYNPVDQYFYGMKYEENTLFRVNPDGSVTVVGNVSGLPTGNLKAFTSGTFDTAGNYYIKVQGDTKTIYVVNVNTRTFTSITLSKAIEVSDMAFVNGVLYSVGNNGQLYKIEINGTTGTVTDIGTAYATATGAQLGAQFGATNGLFGTANDGSGFYYIDVNTGVRTRLSASPVAESNDGANCPAQSLDFPADLAITKAAGSYVAGSPLVYTIVVSNNGPFDVTNARVTDALPAGITSAQWTCTAAGNASCGVAAGTGGIDVATAYVPFNGTLTYKLSMDVPADYTGNLVNTATVALPENTPLLVDADLTNNTASVTSVQSVANLGITKTDGNGIYVAGTEVTYTIMATNAGPDAVTGATVSDLLPAGIAQASWSCVASTGSTCTANGTGALNDKVNLASGATATYTLVMTVPVTFSGTLANTATVQVPAGVIDPDIANNTATDADAQASANLSITKTDGAASYKPGTDVSYTITVANSGPDAATGATVSDLLPAGITKASWTCVSNGGVCAVSGNGALSDTVNLPAGATAIYTMVMSVPTTFSGTLLNTATVHSPAGVVDPDPANNTATDSDAQASADLSIAKTDGATSYKPGTDVTYTITATNAGPDAVTGATVSDALPAGITKASWTCAPTGGATCATSGSGALSDKVNLPAGASATYSLVMSVPSTFSGTLVNTATVQSPAGVLDPVPGNNTATDSDAQNSADLSITKTDGATSYKPGTDVTYTITATNAGPDAVTDATVSDLLPAGITKASWTCASAGGTTCAASGSGALNDKVSLPAGASATYTLIMSVPSTFTGALVNTAKVAQPTDTIDPNAANNTATDTDEQRAEEAVAATPVPVGGGWILLMLSGLVGLVATRFGARRRG